MALILIDEYDAISRYSRFMSTYHHMNIVVQTKWGDAYSPNGKIESIKNTLEILKELFSWIKDIRNNCGFYLTNIISGFW